MVKESVRKINRTCVISIAYVLLTLLSSSLGLMVGSIQFNLSEALCILPMFTPLAVPGIVIGSFIANIIRGGVFLDVVISTFATLLGIIGVRILRKYRWVAPICPVLSNMIIMPVVFQQIYHVSGYYLSLMFMIGFGEFICAYLLGQMIIDFIHGDFPSLKRK